MLAGDDLLVRIEVTSNKTLTSRILREQLLGLVRRRVAFDAHVFALTDPVTMVGTSPHAAVPMMPWARLPELIRSRYLTRLNRHDTLSPDTAASLRTAAEPSDDPPLWRVLHEIGITDTATVAFKDSHGTWGFLDLWRATETFSRDDLAFLSDAAPSITAGLRASQARTFSAADPDDTPLGAAVVILDADLRVRTHTEGAAAALLRLLPPDEHVPPIPAVAYNVGAALIAQEQGIGIGPPWSRVHIGGSHWVTARASRLGRDIAVSIEPSTSEERLDLIARSHCLSERESVVLSLIAAGLDTKQMAKRLFLSDHTANDHVRAVLSKTGARTRQILLARILGTGESAI